MPVDDVTMQVLSTAMRGLAQRQRVTADNIANISTPGYHAGRVDFESALRDAVSSGGDVAVPISTGSSLEPTREDGNNVNLDEETLSTEETGLRYQLTINAMNAKFGLLRNAIHGGN